RTAATRSRRRGSRPSRPPGCASTARPSADQQHRLTTHQEIIFVLVLIPSVILHEIMHGVVALAFGDDTAKRAGRLTLNPIPHIDPVGSVALPLLLAVAGAPIFGWAKPVPVNPRQLRNPRQQSLLVSLAGPATNIALAIG